MYANRMFIQSFALVARNSMSTAFWDCEFSRLLTHKLCLCSFTYKENLDGMLFSLHGQVGDAPSKRSLELLKTCRRTSESLHVVMAFFDLQSSILCRQLLRTDHIHIEFIGSVDRTNE